MSIEEHKALYSRWLLEMWNGDLALADELVTPDFVVHQMSLQTEEVRGPEGLREMIRQGTAPFAELTFSIAVGPIAQGDMVAARWTGTGIYGGGIPGASAPAGTEITFGGMDIMRVADGRFAEYWVSSDGLYLMAKLGAL